MTKWFTVIGHYEFSGACYCGHVRANDAEEAAKIVAQLQPEEDIMIAAVIKGNHKNSLEGLDYLRSTQNDILPMVE